MAISKNLAKSLFDFLDEPSAIFEGIDTDALLSWVVKPNLSSSGKLKVTK